MNYTQARSFLMQYFDAINFEQAKLLQLKEVAFKLVDIKLLDDLLANDFGSECSGSSCVFSALECEAIDPDAVISLASLVASESAKRSNIVQLIRAKSAILAAKSMLLNITASEYVDQRLESLNSVGGDVWVFCDGAIVVQQVSDGFYRVENFY